MMTAIILFRKENSKGCTINSYKYKEYYTQTHQIKEHFIQILYVDEENIGI